MQHCADCYPKIYQQQPKPYSTLLMKTFQIWKLFLLADLILFIHPVISDSKKIKIELSLVLSVPAEEQFLVFKLYFSKESVWRFLHKREMKVKIDKLQSVEKKMTGSQFILNVYG